VADSIRRVDKGQPRARIDYPHGGNAEAEIIPHAFFEPAGGVVLRGDLDAEDGWAGDDLLFQTAADRANVGNPKTVPRNLHALLRQCTDGPERFISKQNARNEHLQPAVIVFAEVPFDDFPADIFAIRPVCGIQIMLDGRQHDLALFVLRRLQR
jgi:hypothetical protein